MSHVSSDSSTENSLASGDLFDNALFDTEFHPPMTTADSLPAFESICPDLCDWLFETASTSAFFSSNRDWNNLLHPPLTLDVAASPTRPDFIVLSPHYGSWVTPSYECAQAPPAVLSGSDGYRGPLVANQCTDASFVSGVALPGLPAVIGIGRRSSSTDLLCNWPECATKGPFKTIEESKLHTKDHARDVRRDWESGKKCTWYGCTSRAHHKSSKLFETHLNNIHVNPLICTIKGCPHKTPFRANTELQRHIATMHAAQRKFTCPYGNCNRGDREFSRKDKLILHLQYHHDTEPCPYAHCLSGQTLTARESTAKHIGKSHGNFECALQYCKGSTSRFLESALLEHLQLYHAMDWELVLKARDVAKTAPDHVIRDEHICYD